MSQTADVGSGRRRALVIATSTYTDTKFTQLRTPGRDAEELAAVLGDADVGKFDVETVRDQPTRFIKRRIAEFCRAGRRDDLALIYLSCHGVLDSLGQLYYATVDTEHEWLEASAMEAEWLLKRLDECACRRQVLVLDCCHSGAFAKGAKGASDDAVAAQQAQLKGDREDQEGRRDRGRGRVVLTASRATELSFEGGDVSGELESSVFTGAIVKGLRTGEADSNGNGEISANELFDYASDAVQRARSDQNPTMWAYGAEGSVAVAFNPKATRLGLGRSAHAPTMVAVPPSAATVAGEFDALMSALNDLSPALETTPSASDYLLGPNPYVLHWPLPLHAAGALGLPFERLSEDAQFNALFEQQVARQLEADDALGSGEPDRAEAIYRECLDRADQLEVPDLLARGFVGLARVAMRRGDAPAMRRWMSAARSVLVDRPSRRVGSALAPAE